MALPIAIAALGKMLVANGLPLVANALLSKGKEVVEDKLGVKLDIGMTAEQLRDLKMREIEHQEFLINAAMEETRINFDWLKAEGKEVTERHKADMASDSWMSKNVRPMMLVYIVLAYTVFAGGSAFDLNVKQPYVDLMAQWGMLIMSFYFGGRTIEKIVQMRAEK